MMHSEVFDILDSSHISLGAFSGNRLSDCFWCILRYLTLPEFLDSLLLQFVREKCPLYLSLDETLYLSLQAIVHTLALKYIAKNKTCYYIYVNLANFSAGVNSSVTTYSYM